MKQKNLLVCIAFVVTLSTCYNLLAMDRISNKDATHRTSSLRNTDSVKNTSHIASNLLKKQDFLNALKEKYDVCVIGAGLSGTVFAERYSSLFGKKVLIIEERNHIGGNCYDFVDTETGILMNKYGAHLFHTNSEKAYSYITMHSNAPPWIRWDHKVVGWVKNKLVPIPVNIETINTLFDLSIKNEEEMNEWLRNVQIPCENNECRNAEEMAKSRVGQKLFDLIFKDYTVKQWAKQPADLDKLVTARIPVRNSFDPRYFDDKYQLLPSLGYTKWFEALLLDKEKITIALEIDYFEFKPKIDSQCEEIIYTGPVDKYFQKKGVKLESLEYRSINFEVEKLFNINGFSQPNSVVNYPSKDVDFTRIVEYKHFLHQKSPHTVIVKEFSTSSGDPYYPVPNPRNMELYNKYQKLAENEERTRNVHFVGRLANYKYFNMDAAIVNALEMFDLINAKK